MNAILAWQDAWMAAYAAGASKDEADEAARGATRREPQAIAEWPANAGVGVASTHATEVRAVEIARHTGARYVLAGHAPSGAATWHVLKAL